MTTKIPFPMMAGSLPIGQVDSTVSQLFGFRNRIINGNPLINQRVVSGTVTLSAGVYGHDRWKAGASGCTYTFATVDNVTTLTITAGSLIQVVEGLNLETGTYCLSWTGTAQGKIGAGSYSASGVTGSITGGTNTNIEFNTGTLTKVQLERGSTPTPFEARPFAVELMMCQRYFEKSYAYSVAPGTASGSILYDTISGLYGRNNSVFKVVKRAAATAVAYSGLNGAAGYINNAGSNTGLTISATDTVISWQMTANSAGNYATLDWTASAEL